MRKQTMGMPQKILLPVLCLALTACVFALNTPNDQGQTPTSVPRPTDGRIPSPATSSPVPTVDGRFPIETPTQVVSSDPRIEELEKLGIPLSKSCNAPCFSGLRQDLTLREIIAILGNPDRVDAYVNHQGEFSTIIGELFYVNRGITVFSDRPIDKLDEIMPDMSVYRIDLWKARSLNELKSEMQRELGSSQVLDESQEWKGFGAIKVWRR